MRLIALCWLTMAVIYGAAFAQQPTPTATPTPAPDIGARISHVASERQALSDVSERERILLERIERLERRLNELESRLAAPPLPSLTNTNAVLPANTTVSAPQPTQTNQPPAPPQFAAWDKDGVKIIPFGILVANVNYNTSGLAPGSVGFFALPDLPIDTAQFNISPGNTYLGVELKWPKIGKWEINGKVDFNLRGADPLAANNIFQPQFFNIYGEAKTERVRLLAGQAQDVVSPLFPNTLNQYPIRYIPGSLGYFRPQVRLETYQPISDNFTFIFRGAVAEAIQTFDVGNEVVGKQTGKPDGQARVAVGYGKPAPDDPFQKRLFEVGISGHIGERRGTLLTQPIVERDFTSWSENVDLSFKLGGKLRFEAEYFRGSVLGDYVGGAFQT
ncbi:MAG: hypothetical protein ACREBD_34975, partial [Blastocatellia bacterium]